MEGDIVDNTADDSKVSSPPVICITPPAQDVPKHVPKDVPTPSHKFSVRKVEKISQPMPPRQKKTPETIVDSEALNESIEQAPETPVDTEPLTDNQEKLSSSEDANLPEEGSSNEKFEENGPSDKKLEENGSSDEKLEESGHGVEKLEKDGPADEKLEGTTEEDKKLDAEIQSQGAEEDQPLLPGTERVEIKSPDTVVFKSILVNSLGTEESPEPSTENGKTFGNVSSATSLTKDAAGPAEYRRIRRISWKDDPSMSAHSLKSELESRREMDPLMGRDPNDPDLDTLLDLPAELPTPPDGGWGWVIVIASFFANMVVDGVAYSFSPFLPIFATYFDEPQGKVAWISSLLAGVYLSAGPVVSALSNRFGCRAVCMAGSVIASLAFLSTAWANSVPYLMVTQGLIGGFGFGLIYLPAVVVVGYHFEKKRALATGIAVCGSGVGTMLFPPFVKWLIAEYSWRGANIVLAAIILQCAMCGALMRPLTVPRMTKRDLVMQLAREEKELLEELDGGRKRSSSSNGDPGVSSQLNLGARVGSGLSVLPTIREARQPAAAATEADGPPPAARVPLLKADGVRPRFITSVGSVPNFERKRSRHELINHLKVIPASSRPSQVSLAERRNSSASAVSATPLRAVGRASGSSEHRTSNIMLRPMSRQDIFYTGSISNLHEYKSQLSMVGYRESTMYLPGTGASQAVLSVMDADVKDAEATPEKTGCLPEAIMGTLRHMLDLRLLSNPVFLLIGFANVFGMLGFYTPYVYLPAAAVEKGIDPESATFLISIIGITNTIGRVLSGLIADIECVNALYVNNVCVFLSGMCVFAVPFASTYTQFSLIAVFFGFFVSPFIALTSIILVDLLGLPLLSSAFGLLCIFRGVAGIVSSPISGSIYDATQSYDVSFYAAGCLLLCCAALHCLVPMAARSCAGHATPVRYTTNKHLMDEVEEGHMGEDGEGITLNIGPKEGRLGSIREGEAV